MCRRFFLFLFVIVVGLAVGFVWLVQEATPPHIFPNPKAIAPADAHAAERRLQEALGLSSARPKPTEQTASSPAKSQTVDSAGNASGRGNITIHLSQDDINTTLATNSDIKQQMAAHGVQAAQIAFAPPNLVTAYVKVTYHDQPAVAEVTGTLGSNPEGALQFTAQSVKVANVPVPVQSAQKVIDRAMALLLPKADAALPLSVQQVSVQGKDIYLTGLAKKRME